LHDQRFSYGLDLTFTLRVGEEGARASVDDVIIEGDGRRISAPIFAQDNQVVQIIIIIAIIIFNNNDNNNADDALCFAVYKILRKVSK